MVYAGILPHTSFGAALRLPSKGELKVTQGMLGVGLKKPLGTSQVLAQAVDRPGRSAKFVFIEAVGRWAREGCLLASRCRPLDALTAREVVSAAQATRQSLDGKLDVARGRLAALRGALHEQGCCIKARARPLCGSNFG